MKISSIKIVNFKGVKNRTIVPQHMNIFLGKNGSGKSSVLDAITFAFTGKVKSSYIRNDAKSAGVIVEFEDGTTIERSRSQSGTTIKCNGKKTTQKSVNEFLEEKLGASEKTYEALCGTDYLSGLSQKELSALFLSVLPANITFSALKDIADDIQNTNLYRNMDEEEAEYLEELFQPFIDTDTSFGLDEIAIIYKKAFETRKELKILVKNQLAKTQFDNAALPKETKEELEAAIHEIAKKEAQATEYQSKLQAYERSLKLLKEAEAKKESLVKNLETFGGLEKPAPETFQQAEEEKAKFESAIGKSRAMIGTFQSNLKMFRNTLENLNKPICPLSDKLVCSTDKSAVKEDLERLVAENDAHLKEHETFIKRCEEQIEKRNTVMKKYNEDLLRYTQKESIQKQLAEFVLPEVLEKPEVVETADFNQQKADINQKLRTLSVKEVVDEEKKKLEVLQKDLQLAEFAVSILDVKTGVPARILEKTMKNFEILCNKKAASISPDLKVKLNCVEEIEIFAETKKDAGFLPLEVLSTGEYLLVVFLLMDILNQITNARYLVIDNLDKLDAEYAKSFLDLLDSDSSYEHIFVGAVNHKDTEELLKGTNVTIL